MMAAYSATSSFRPLPSLSAADWLSTFGVPISAYAVSVAEHGGEVLLSIDQKFPLAGLDDVYVGRRPQLSGSVSETSWGTVIADCEFPFAQRAVEIFTRRIQGSPHRRAFSSIYSDCPLGILSIAFRRKYLKVYTHDQSPEAQETLRARLGESIPFLAWGNETTSNSGYTFAVETEAQFLRFLEAVEDAPA